MSTTAASPVSNGTANIPQASKVSQNTNLNGGRPQLKTSTPGRVMDGARKQAGSPSDASQRKLAQKAWHGNNPITARSVGSSVSNGVSGTNKPVTPLKQAGPPVDPQNVQQHSNDRLMFLLANFVGLSAHITLKDGTQYTGIFSSVSLDAPELRYVFKMVKRVQSPEQQANGASEGSHEYSGSGENYVMSFDIVDVADLSVKDVSFEKVQNRSQNGTSSSFRTDVDISGNLAIRERNLQKWEPSEDAGLEMSLDDSKGGWDQFEANERLYGVKSDYDENIYTTTIDRTNPLYRQRLAQAEKIAREIDESNALNAHVAEERGQASPGDGGADEEEKYSGVQRGLAGLSSGQPNKYTPPARRAPTSQATVPGAPIDPAIISSQISRPGDKSQRPTSSNTTSSTGQAKALEQAQQEGTETNDTKPISASKTDLGTEEREQKEKVLPPPKPQATTNAASGANRKPARPENATDNVEVQLLDSFKQFSANEKLKMQEHQRKKQSHDKAVKLNELKKFSMNFKLNTPVPTDLVPILAKDETKQQEIVEKSRRVVQELKTTPPKPAAPTLDSKTARSGPSKVEAGQPIPSTQNERQPSRGPRQNQAPYNSASYRGDRAAPQGGPAIPSRSRPGQLGQRLALSSSQHTAGIGQPGFPPPGPIHDLRIPPPVQSGSSSGVQTPSSSVSTRFNVKAMEFKPNPAANTFTPGGNTSSRNSPRTETPARPERRKTPVSFFGQNKPAAPPDLAALDDSFNPIKRMKKEIQDENRSKEFAANGGIPQAYRTPPTWDVPKANQDKTYSDMFERPSSAMQYGSGPQVVSGNGPMPHHHQLPPHLQQAPQNMSQHQTPHHTPRHPPAQPHGPPPQPFDGHHMQFSTSSSSVHPSPRAAPPFIYAQAPQGIPPGAVFQQPIQGYGMSPSVHHLALRQQGGHQLFNAQGQQISGHIMANQPPSGPYVGMPNPQMNHAVPMYATSGGHVFPHPNGPMIQQAASNGYPSPRPPGAQMMSHQGSQQGHPPQPMIYMTPNGPTPVMFTQMPAASMTPMRGPYPQQQQPHFGSPHQPHIYPHHPQRNTPQTQYSQPMMPSHSLPPQAPQPSGPATHMMEGDDIK